MAVTWSFKITVVDVARHTVTVVGTRTDDSVTPIDERTYPVEGKYEKSQATLDSYADVFWQLYQDDLAREAQIDTLIGQAETQLAAALQAKETP